MEARTLSAKAETEYIREHHDNKKKIPFLLLLFLAGVWQFRVSDSIFPSTIASDTKSS